MGQIAEPDSRARTKTTNDGQASGSGGQALEGALSAPEAALGE